MKLSKDELLDQMVYRIHIRKQMNTLMKEEVEWFQKLVQEKDDG